MATGDDELVRINDGIVPWKDHGGATDIPMTRRSARIEKQRR
ncbi:uncharacterized protein G2W53_041374 [Senna tora]|uniref:Uncharacterized protein n=1 Tax=Senna tora TaxID=362788 RepID=A0A834VXW3_9FABA|nr:uncharacterized protein G2W53_041374 [Senna tora]